MERGAEKIDEVTRRFLAIVDDTEDPRMAWGAVKTRIDALRKAGHKVPAVLIRAERHLMCDLTAESQGR